MIYLRDEFGTDTIVTIKITATFVRRVGISIKTDCK